MRFYILNPTQLLTNWWPVSHFDMGNGNIKLVVPNSGKKEIHIPLKKPERWSSLNLLEDHKQRQKIVGHASLNNQEVPTILCNRVVRNSSDDKDPRAIVYDLQEAYVDGYGPDDACIIWHYITKNMASGIVPMMTIIPPYGKNKIGMRTLPTVDVKGAGLLTQFDNRNFNMQKAMSNDWEHCPQVVFVMIAKPGSRWAFHGINMEYASGFCEVWEYVLEQVPGFTRPLGLFKKIGANQTQGIRSYQQFIDWVDTMLKNPQMWRQDTREMAIRQESLADEIPREYNPNVMINMLNQKVIHRPPVDQWN